MHIQASISLLVEQPIVKERLADSSISRLFGLHGHVGLVDNRLRISIVT